MNHPVFHSTATDGLELGADALIFVMDNHHALTIPIAALYFAQKVAIVSIARKPSDAVLREVNAAIDVIAATIRNRERVDRENTATEADSGRTADDRPNIGPMARLQDAPIVRPPNGSHALTVPVADPF